MYFMRVMREPSVTTPARASDKRSVPLSLRARVGVAAATLGVGIAIGAALGPVPQASFAGGAPIPQILATLLSSAASAGSGAPSASANASPQGSSQATAGVRRRNHKRRHAYVSAGSSTQASSQEGTIPSSSGTSTTTTAKLKPVTSVWLIVLSGESFSGTLAAPAAAPYIDGQLVPSGTLETSWTALDGSAFASDASLAGLRAPEGSPSPIIDQITQPPCPEGAAGTACAAGTPGALTAADNFARQTVALISANALYKAHGLIVVTFATLTQASAAGLPEGATSATLTAQPPAGVLLISPFIRGGVRSASTFDSTSPTRALSALLGK
jgi:hypothetical protein